MLQQSIFIRNISRCLFSRQYLIISRAKSTIDYSNVPEINEEDIEEQYVRGSGPGGQSVNKTANCVVLKHTPTGIIIKCHETRSLSQNRKIARSILLTKLDNLINNKDSIEGQIKKKEHKKIMEKNRRRNKLQELKDEWKERENMNK